MPLSDTACKHAHLHEKTLLGKQFTLADGFGLSLLVKRGKNGWIKGWRFKYRFEGKDRLMALGIYPTVSLSMAREKRDELRKQVAQGIDPVSHKKAVIYARTKTVTNSFEVVAREWLKLKCNDKSPRPARHLGFVLPWIGEKPIDEIMPKDILACLRRVQDNGAVYSAIKALQMYGQIFRYAVATGRCERDITYDLKGALQSAKKQHFSAITEPKEVAELLRAIDGFSGSFSVHCALRLAPLFFVRPGELRAAKWADFDFVSCEWRYLVTKTNVQHIVPLCTQAVSILEELKPLTSHGVWLFPSERNPRNTLEGRCMSENTLNVALRRLGYSKEQMTSHGFRALARTCLDEVLGFRPDFIEQQLAHAVRDPLGRAYNRAKHLQERKKMMQAWADYLDSLIA
jgi:integrase